MIIYILKFSACLALFLVFYKLVLEKENMHIFKRFYLLGTLLLSIGIPLITFTYYVEPSGEIFPQIIQNIPLQKSAILLEPDIDYLPIILWSIYGFGVFLFGINFLKNLYDLNYKIKHNPKQKNNRITNVLLKDLVIPHTFFNYIFLNKRKFETHQIPKEVFWHEETHAIQKHSIDVLFIEILQIVFWFNPLIYIIKHVVKLNHEFLADQAVLKKGVETATYQETLLAFSSNAMHPQLANAINYSSIKKRFTVMKTQTTKKAIWLRSLILLPLLSAILYGFSERKEILLPNELIENKYDTTSYTNQKTNSKSSEDILLFIRNNGELVVNNKITQIKILGERLNYLNSHLTFEERKKQITASIFIEPNTKISIINDVKQVLKTYGIINLKIEETIFPESLKSYTPGVGYPVLELSLNPLILKINGRPSSLESLEKDFNIATVGKKSNICLETEDEVSVQLLQDLIKKLGSNALSIIIDPTKIKVTDTKKIKLQQKATKEQVAEYNKLAKKYNDMPKDNMVIKSSDLERIKYLYDLMSVEQRKKAQPFPSFPPPPPPPAPKAKQPDLPPPPPLPKNVVQVGKTLFTKPTRLYKVKAPQKNGQILLVTEEYAKNHPEDVIELSMKDFDFIPLEKEELIRIWEKEAKKQKEIQNKMFKQLKSKVKDQKIYTEEEINKRAREEKRAYKEAHRIEKELKKKSKNKEN